jgi:hypothetical protein
MYWVYLVEKDNKVFGEARAAIIDRLKELATNQLPDSAFKSENTWNNYLKTKRRSKPKSVFQRLGLRMKSQSRTIFPSIPIPVNQAQTKNLPRGRTVYFII